MRQQAEKLADGRSNFMDIRDTLRRFGTAPDVLARERRSLPAKPRDCLDVLLREVDETVLARRITLHSNDANLASLTVSNRRLVRFEEAVPQGAEPRSQKPTAGELADRLLDISKRTTGFSTEAVSKQDIGTGSEAGYSVSALRAEFGVRTGQNTIAHLAQLLRKSAVAQLIWTADMDNADFAGDDKWHAFLKNFAKAALDDAQQTQSAFSNVTHPAALALPITRETALIFACDARSGFAAITALDKGLNILGDWQLTTSAA